MRGWQLWGIEREVKATQEVSERCIHQYVSMEVRWDSEVHPGEPQVPISFPKAKCSTPSSPGRISLTYQSVLPGGWSLFYLGSGWACWPRSTPAPNQILLQWTDITHCRNGKWDIERSIISILMAPHPKSLNDLLQQLHIAVKSIGEIDDPWRTLQGSKGPMRQSLIKVINAFIRDETIPYKGSNFLNETMRQSLIKVLIFWKYIIGWQ